MSEIKTISQMTEIYWVLFISEHKGKTIIILHYFENSNKNITLDTFFFFTIVLSSFVKHYFLPFFPFFSPSLNPTFPNFIIFPLFSLLFLLSFLFWIFLFFFFLITTSFSNLYSSSFSQVTNIERTIISCFWLELPRIRQYPDDSLLLSLT